MPGDLPLLFVYHHQEHLGHHHLLQSPVVKVQVLHHHLLQVLLFLPHLHLLTEVLFLHHPLQILLVEVQEVLLTLAWHRTLE